ncbi:transcriptional repressor TraM [Microvirga sp. W0021]|uniref:Transcriptional repressor TraM n=1 Tax=Hohaiivirga grylli TaxID=3133970 RepID=A0ABV0BHZ4_9HYPH
MKKITNIEASNDNDEHTASDLEDKARVALQEHRRLAASADEAYENLQYAYQQKVPLTDEIFSQLQINYLKAMIEMQFQQDELNKMLNKLGYIPKISTMGH